jgi:hypothetical protein
VAYAHVWDAEYEEVMEAKPATTAGAVALLRFTAGLMETLFDDDEHEHYIGAIRNAADFFEGRASAWSKKPKSPSPTSFKRELIRRCTSLLGS